MKMDKKLSVTPHQGLRRYDTKFAHQKKQRDCQFSHTDAERAPDHRDLCALDQPLAVLVSRRFDQTMFIVLDPETGPQWLRTFLFLSDFPFPKALSFLNRS